MNHPTIIALQGAITSPERLKKYAQVAKLAHGCDNETAETIVLAELQFMCNRLSVIDLNKHKLNDDRAKAILLEVLMSGLSFSPTSDHVYLQPSFNNLSELTYYPSPYGLLHLCHQAGSVDYVTKPVIVYEGDSFRVGTNENGNQVVLHSALQHPQNKPAIIGGYVFVVTGGNREPFWMDRADVERLKLKSKRNGLYTSNNGDIDPSFFGGKLIKHALKSYRKKSILNLPDEEDVPVTTIETQPAMTIEPPAPYQTLPQAPSPEQQPQQQIFNAPPPMAF